MEFLYIFFLFFGVGCFLALIFGLLGLWVAILKAIVVWTFKVWPLKMPELPSTTIQEPHAQSDKQIQQFEERLKQWEAKINCWAERIRQDGDARRARLAQRFRIRQADRQ